MSGSRRPGRATARTAVNACVAVIAAASLLSRTSGAQEAVTAPLMRPFAGDLAGNRAILFANLQAQPTTRRARLAALDRNAFAGDRVSLALFPDLELAAQRMDIGPTGIQSPSWTGRLPDGGSVAFVIHGDRISGTICSTQGNFRVLPLGGGDCAVVELDTTRIPDCAVGKVARPPEGAAASRREANAAGGDLEPPDRSVAAAAAGTARNPVPLDTPTGNRVRVLVAYTADAKSRTSSSLGQTMQELIDLAVLESNQGYANSGVTLRMELAVLYQTTFNESAAIENDVAKFRNSGDGIMDEVHTVRANYDADMCSLILDGTDPDWCGWAYDFDHTAYGNMFQATVFSCATGNYSFAHEFGHTQGCRHDNDGTLTPFPYGHGFRNGNNWRTIMAVAGTSSAPRLNYWSNPSINSPVAPFTAMGTAINGGNFANDCRSALNAGDDAVVQHETTPIDSVAPTGTSVSADEYGDKLVTGALTIGSFTASSGSRVQFRAGSRVVLNPGFHAASGSSFRARLAGPLGDAPVATSAATSHSDQPATSQDTAQ